MFGDKTAAKRLAQAATIPTIPGTDHALADPAVVVAEAARIGYPLMIKASFGGGGRGMRVVNGPDELEAKLAEAQREAGAAFGRPDVFLERYIARAKHIEVQILGDAHGNLVHLWERDCSVQRRHQKVVEVAPSINLSRRSAQSHLRRGGHVVPVGQLPQRRHRRVPRSISIAAITSSSRSTRESRSNTR